MLLVLLGVVSSVPSQEFGWEEISKMTYFVFSGMQNLALCLQCFDAVGWAAGRAPGL